MAQSFPSSPSLANLGAIAHRRQPTALQSKWMMSDRLRLYLRGIKSPINQSRQTVSKIFTQMQGMQENLTLASSTVSRRMLQIWCANPVADEIS
ncbi:MAG TPA: hypothetical protein IGS37_18845 [Synechococcales cyanobacterium M55_K2018_004]|nr:hypothetical protein [Synechococcales cyanobacterium M55_K2018_004]